MKTCPICHAVAFDDAAICYGCLHRFADNEEHRCIEGDDSLFAIDSKPEERTIPTVANADMPSFSIRFTPLREPSGVVAWSCSIEQQS